MKNTLLHIWNFYIEGFRSMTLGRTLAHYTCETLYHVLHSPPVFLPQLSEQPAHR